MKLPEWACVDEVNSMLVFFAALLLRFSTQILVRPHTPSLLPGAAKLASSTCFKRARLCQWSFFLDRGSLVNFHENILKLVAPTAGPFGWLRQFDVGSLTVEVWGKMLPRVALGCTIFAEGLAHSRAIGADGAKELDASRLKRMVQQAGRVAYPYGRALNGIGNVNPLLTGQW
jgi:hypothetical protein